jgi:hypothetical protein
MYPNIIIDKILNEKKDSLIFILSQESKLPVTDIQIIDFDIKSNSGNLKLIIYETKSILIHFEYKENSFHYDISKIDKQLDNIWFQIYLENQQLYFEKICTLLKLDETNIERISTGKRPNLYLYKKGAFIHPNLLNCSLENSSWTLTLVK